jgi:hypothetical protein
LVSAINGFVNIVAALILVRIIGYYGVLVAVLLSLFLSSISMIYLFHKATGYSFLKYIQSLPWKLLAIVSGLTGSIWLISLKITNWRGFFGIVIAFSILHIVALIVLLKEDEKELIKKIKFSVLSPTNSARG